MIGLSIIAMLLTVTDAFSQRGRAPRPEAPPQSRPYVDVRPVQMGQMQRMHYMQQRDQRGSMQNCLNIESLTAEQKDALKKMHVARMDKSIQHRSQMELLQARQRNAMIQKEPDMKEVNKIIDEMGALRTTGMKEAVAHRLAIRKMLTEEQRVIFDSRSTNRPMMRGRR